MRFCCLCLLVVGFFTAPVLGQPSAERRERGRQFVDGVLRTLIESQVDPSRSPQPPAHATAATPQLREAMATLAGFSNEAEGLIAALRNEARYSSAVLPLLGDAIRVKAAADVLIQKGHFVRSEAQLLDDVRSLDQQWRVLSHRLQQTAGLGAASVNHVRQLDSYDQRLCQLLKIAPQLDRGELIGLLVALAANLSNLLEDVSLDVPIGQQREGLLMAGRKLLVQVEQATDAVGQNATRNDVVARYEACCDLWREFAVGLRGVESESLGRTFRRIDRLDRHIHETLWIDYPMDRSVVAYFAASLERGIDRLALDVPLDALLGLPKPQETSAALIELNGLCRSFTRSAEGKGSPDDLLWDFRLIEVQWQQTRAGFEPAGNPIIARHLAQISATVEALGESLNVRPVSNRDEAISLAGSVDELAVVFDQTLREHLSKNAYSTLLRSQLLSKSHAFHESAHRLHESVVRGDGDDVLRRQCNDLAAGWNQLAGLLPQLSRPSDPGMRELQQKIVANWSGSRCSWPISRLGISPQRGRQPIAHGEKAAGGSDVSSPFPSPGGALVEGSCLDVGSGLIMRFAQRGIDWPSLFRRALIVNGKQRILAALKREIPDVVPVFEWFVDVAVGRALVGSDDVLDVVERLDLDAVNLRANYRSEPIDEKTLVDEWGMKRQLTGDVLPALIGSPIEDVTGHAEYTFPDPEASHRFESIERAVERFGDERAVVLNLRDGFSDMRDLLGYEGTLTAMLLEPERFDELLERCVEYNLKLAAVAQERYGTQIVATTDDVANATGLLMRPATYFERLGPGFKTAIGGYKELGYLTIKHCDGNVDAVLDFWIEAGIDCLDPIDPAGGYTIGGMKQRIGDKVCLKGNVDCTGNLCDGTPEDVAEEVRRCIEQGAAGGGLILSSSNTIHRGVKPENFQAMIRAVREFGVCSN